MCGHTDMQMRKYLVHKRGLIQTLNQHISIFAHLQIK
jgi:hypothetical protein